MNKEQSLYSGLSDTELLGKLIGVRQTQKRYRGSLGAMFAPVHDKDKQQPEKCVVARELVRRWLVEEIMHGDMLNSPATVRDYLRIHFAGREHESFVAIFLDAQHQVIVVDELIPWHAIANICVSTGGGQGITSSQCRCRDICTQPSQRRSRTQQV